MTARTIVVGSGDSQEVGRDSSFPDLRVVRNGAWSSWPMDLRSAARAGCESKRRGCWTSFRVVQALNLQP
jgi:formylglycine-generating enzyme required for sulfatase activity